MLLMATASSQASQQSKTALALTDVHNCGTAPESFQAFQWVLLGVLPGAFTGAFPCDRRLFSGDAPCEWTLGGGLPDDWVSFPGRTIEKKKNKKV